MRADRLITLLMLLQTRGKMSAESLASELEVSVRTIYRDLAALSASGVPVYAERGPGGGCALIEEYRTNLTGLRPEEARALFMLSIPAPLDQLGVGQELRGALLKLSAALPDSRRKEQVRSRQRIHLDASWWGQAGEPVPHLQSIQQALWNDKTLDICYLSEFGTRIEHIIAPYGLVAKANVWYLVGAKEGHVRVFRVSRISEAGIRAESFERPENFDLQDFWQRWCDEVEHNRPVYSVRVRVSPQLFQILERYFDRKSIHPEAGPSSQAASWPELTLDFDSFEAAREKILSLGRAIEVLEPLPLRESVIDFARQILGHYEGEKSNNA
jgi:predicted DNA-binding transcriptional regulator YafY